MQMKNRYAMSIVGAGMDWIGSRMLFDRAGYPIVSVISQKKKFPQRTCTKYLQCRKLFRLSFLIFIARLELFYCSTGGIHFGNCRRNLKHRISISQLPFSILPVHSRAMLCYHCARKGQWSFSSSIQSFFKGVNSLITT